MQCSAFPIGNGVVGSLPVSMPGVMIELAALVSAEVCKKFRRVKWFMCLFA